MSENAEAVVTKSQDDLVRLENIGVDKDGKKVPFVIFNYDGGRYEVKDSIILKRFIAEHGVKKAHSLETHKYSLQIKELPYGQRSPEQFPDALEEVEKAQLQIKQLKEENQKLKQEVVTLSKENDELANQVAKLVKKK